MVTQNFQDFLDKEQDIANALARVSSSCKFTAGSDILRQDDSDNHVIFLNNGRAKAVIFSLGGHEIWLDEFGAGAIFGELAALLKTRRTSDVVAITDCEGLRLTADALNDLMMGHPAFALFMTKLLASRLRHTTQHMYEGISLSVPHRVRAELIRMAIEDEENSELYYIRPIPTVTDIGARLNISRESASRAMTQLEKQRLLKRDKREWIILQPEF